MTLGRLYQAAARIVTHVSTKYSSFTPEGQSTFSAISSSVVSLVTGNISVWDIALGDFDTYPIREIACSGSQTVKLLA